MYIIYTYESIHVCGFISESVWVYMYVYTYIYVNMHICIYIYIGYTY
jgi:hypothetical protein